MIIWFFKSIFVNLMTIIAYLINPIVVLFCNEKGELPKWLEWAGTPDNISSDIRWMVYEHCVPSFAEYNYDKHYVYHYEEKGDVEFVPGYVDLIDPNFTFKEKIQRYICRLCWLNRNPVNGLCSMFDLLFESNQLIVKINENIEEKEHYFAYVKASNNKFWNIIKLIFNGNFCLWIYKRWCPWFCWRIYLGWKFKYVVPDGKKHRSSVAVYISPFRKSN